MIATIAIIMIIQRHFLDLFRLSLASFNSSLTLLRFSSPTLTWLSIFSSFYAGFYSTLLIGLYSSVLMFLAISLRFWNISCIASISFFLFWISTSRSSTSRINFGSIWIYFWVNGSLTSFEMPPNLLSGFFTVKSQDILLFI